MEQWQYKAQIYDSKLEFIKTKYDEVQRDGDKKQIKQYQRLLNEAIEESKECWDQIKLQLATQEMLMRQQRIKK